MRVERHVSRRCPNMGEHAYGRSGVGPRLPVPCDDCYSIESFWRPIDYEPDSRTGTDLNVHTDAELRARDERIIRATWRTCVNTKPSLLLAGPEPETHDAIIAAAEADR